MVSPPFGRIYKRIQTSEGTYRQLHGRLRANVESVALYGGMAKESRTILRGFHELTDRLSSLLVKQYR